MISARVVGHRTWAALIAIAVVASSASLAEGADGSPAASATDATAVLAGDAWIAYQWVIPGGGEGIFLVRPDGTGLHQLVPELDGGQWHPDWSPDGSRIAFIQVDPDDTRGLWVVDADGTDAHQLTHCELPCNNMILPDWAPADPGGIYVGRDANPQPAGPPSTFMLSRFDLGSGTLSDVVVRDDGFTAEEWRISPDGTRAAFTRAPLTEDEGAALFVVDLASGDERRLTTGELFVASPDWLPDGRIVFNAPPLGLFNDGDAGPANLYVVDADGQHLERITDHEAMDTGATQPHVTPDGSGIAFTKLLSRFDRPMAVVDLDGSDERYLTPTQLPGTHVAVRPVTGPVGAGPQ